MNLSEYLEEKRLLAGISLDTVARALDLDSSDFVLAWEVGLVSPPLDKLGIIAKVLKIEQNELRNAISAEVELGLQGPCENQISNIK